MAKRPVFAAKRTCDYVEEKMIEFVYCGGFSIKQKQKSISNLHKSFCEEYPQCEGKILEISSKSENPLGVKLSAFNLKYKTKSGEYYSVESIFQSSKVFSDGSQFTDIKTKPPVEAKKDLRLHEHGGIKEFVLDDVHFPAEPKTLFYDWLYINALDNSEYKDEILSYHAFTDIEFNPKKSINCQARSAAKYVAMKKMGVLKRAMRSPNDFIEIAYCINNDDDKVEQLKIEFN